MCSCFSSRWRSPGVSFNGLPLAGIAFSAAQPPNLWSCFQRRTLRGSTFSRRAISACAIPCSSNRIAHSLLLCNSCGLPCGRISHLRATAVQRYIEDETVSVVALEPQPGGAFGLGCEIHLTDLALPLLPEASPCCIYLQKPLFRILLQRRTLLMQESTIIRRMRNRRKCECGSQLICKVPSLICKARMFHVEQFWEPAQIGKCSTWNNFENQPKTGNVPRGTFRDNPKMGAIPNWQTSINPPLPPLLLPKITEVFHRTAFFAHSPSPSRTPP